jgi:hypothetical protein
MGPVDVRACAAALAAALDRAGLVTPLAAVPIDRASLETLGDALAASEVGCRRAGQERLALACDHARRAAREAESVARVAWTATTHSLRMAAAALDPAAAAPRAA